MPPPQVPARYFDENLEINNERLNCLDYVHYFLLGLHVFLLLY